MGAPVYRASYTGAFKHVFDLVDHRAFLGKPVLLAATGGTAPHRLKAGPISSVSRALKPGVYPFDRFVADVGVRA